MYKYHHEEHEGLKGLIEIYTFRIGMALNFSRFKNRIQDIILKALTFLRVLRGNTLLLLCYYW